MVFSIFHFLKHYYNGIFHISFFKTLLINEGETTRIQGELTPTAFRLVLSAGKLNLPLVPSHDYVLQDNKRCYDKILSDWNFRLPSLGFKCILVGLINMIDGTFVCNFGHQFFFTDIKQFLLAHGYVTLTNDMLKAYKVAQV